MRVDTVITQQHILDNCIRVCGLSDPEIQRAVIQRVTDSQLLGETLPNEERLLRLLATLDPQNKKFSDGARNKLIHETYLALAVAGGKSDARLVQSYISFASELRVGRYLHPEAYHDDLSMPELNQKKTGTAMETKLKFSEMQVQGTSLERYLNARELHVQAKCLYAEGNVPLAERLLESAVQNYYGLELKASAATHYMGALLDFCTIQYYRADLKILEPVSLEAERIGDALLGREHPLTIRARLFRGIIMGWGHVPLQGVALCMEAYDNLRKQLGADHILVADTALKTTRLILAQREVNQKSIWVGRNVLHEAELGRLLSEQAISNDTKDDLVLALRLELRGSVSIRENRGSNRAVACNQSRAGINDLLRSLTMKKDILGKGHLEAVYGLHMIVFGHAGCGDNLAASKLAEELVTIAANNVPKSPMHQQALLALISSYISCGEEEKAWEVSLILKNFLPQD